MQIIRVLESRIQNTTGRHTLFLLLTSEVERPGGTAIQGTPGKAEASGGDVYIVMRLSNYYIVCSKNRFIDPRLWVDPIINAI